MSLATATKLKAQPKPATASHTASQAELVEMGMPVEELVREGRMSIGPTLAQYILDTAPYPRQRRVTKDGKRKMSYLIENGMWEDGFQIAFGLLKGKLYLVNGHHRMHVLVEGGYTKGFQVLIKVLKTEDALHRLYARFDVTGRGRSINDVLKARGTVEEYGVSKSLAVAMMSAVDLIDHDLHQTGEAANKERRVQLAEGWWEYARQLEALSDGCDNDLYRRLIKAGYLAVILVTLKYQPAQAKQFWGAVLSNDGLRRGTPEHALVQAINASQYRGYTNGAVKAAALAWNAAISERTLKTIKVDKEVTPYLMGTPFKKGRKRV